jgi:hypothetical protein
MSNKKEYKDMTREERIECIVEKDIRVEGIGLDAKYYDTTKNDK